MNLLEHGRISGRQFVTLLLACRLTPVFLICNTITLVRSTPTAWVNDVLGCILALPMVWCLARLGSKYPNQTIVQYTVNLLGGLVGGLLVSLYILFMLYIAAFSARSMGETVTTSMTPDTPILVSLIMLIFLAANSARNGLELNGRISEGLMIVSIALFVILCACCYNIMDINELKPFYFTHGLQEIIPPTASVIYYYTEWLVIGMLIPYLRKPVEALRWSLFALFLSGIILVIFCLTMILVFGNQINLLTLPSYNMVRQISLNHYFERVESLIAIIWFFVAGAKVALFLWAAVLAIAQLLKLSDYRPLVYPVGALVTALGYTGVASMVEMIRFLSKPMTIFSLFLTAVMLLSLAGADAIKRRFCAADGRNSP